MLPRMRLMLALMLTVLVAFTGRLMYLQLARADLYSELSAQNFTRETRISPLRGRILARDGTVLADNRLAYDLLYLGGGVERWDDLAALLDLPREALREPDRSKPEERRDGAVLAWNLPDRLIAAVEERIAGEPNLYLRERIERTYPTNLAAQTVGYTTLADPERLPDHAPNELAGAMGIEAGWEEELFGRPGRKLVETDNRGVVLRETVLEPPIPGRDVVLTIDPRAQRIAEDVLRDSLAYINAERDKYGLPRAEIARGALIALEPRTGEILAMAGAPTFDQNVFTMRPTDPAAVQAVLSDRANRPMGNRAVEPYAPASTFKVVTSSALLESGYVAPGTRYACSQSVYYGGIRWENWATYARGVYDVTDAIADSCNTYYWNAAIDTPGFSSGWGPFVQDLVERAREFGFGERVGVGVPEEERGRVPDETWRRQAVGEPWYPGHTLNTVIGQGDVLATPAQIAQFVSTLALDGLNVQPHLVRAVDDTVLAPEVEQVPGRFWSTLRTGMRKMVTDYGSSRFLGPAARFPVTVAGKTGTAQNGKGLHMENVWFMAYAPVEDPQIAVVVFLEDSGSSSAVAVPPMRDFLTRYLELTPEVAATP